VQVERWGGEGIEKIGGTLDGRELLSLRWSDLELAYRKAQENGVAHTMSGPGWFPLSYNQRLH
jgi:hypothetical protein